MAVRLRTGVLTVLMVLAVLGATWSVTEYQAQRRTVDARVAAVAAARQAMVDFVEVDPAALDEGMRRVADAATGEFKAEYAKDRAQLRQAYEANKISARGEVLDAGVVSADSDSATVLLALEQTVTKGGAGKPQHRHYRVRVEMVAERGRWLVSTLAIVS